MSMREEDEACPDCGGPMVKRANRTDGTLFWGCTQYPDCTGTRPLEDRPQRATSDSLPSGRLVRNDSRRWERE